MKKYILFILLGLGWSCSKTSENTDKDHTNKKKKMDSVSSKITIPDFEVQFHHDEEGEKAQENQYIQFNYALTTEQGDTIAETYSTGLPFEVFLKSLGEHDLIFKLVTQMSVGDSASFFTNAKAYHKSENRTLPDSIDPNTRYEFRMKLLSIQTLDEKLRTRRIEEDNTILKYLKANYPNALKDDNSGLYLVYDKKGKGFPPQLGDSIRFKYTTKYLNDILLDSSDDKEVGIMLKQNALIPGWWLAFTRYMNQGTKITLFLPSHLAFGREQKRIQYKNQITRLSTFSILKCELELVKIFQKNQ